MTNEIIKKPSWKQLYDKELIEISNRLTPRDAIMFLNFRAMVDWDVRHKNFNTAKKTIREIQAERLPTWSIGTIWSAKKALINEGLLIPVGRSRVQLNENIIRKAIQTVQSSEPLVQDDGQSRISKIKEDIKNIVKKWHIS